MNHSDPPKFSELLEGHGHVRRLHAFQSLMRHRIREILVVASLYDSFILEEDGHLHEMIISEYHDLNLSHAPSLTRVANGREAVKMLAEERRFDLVLTTPNLADMDAHELAHRVKETGTGVPVVLLAYESRELSEVLNHRDITDFYKVFLWQGDARILLSIIKYIEDRLNVEHDSRSVGVQIIIVIEDNVRFYSAYLPLIYTELVRHAQSQLAEGINVADKLLRMRARPKILLCSSYEEAWDYYKRYEDLVLGVISDIEFPNDGEPDPESGLRFARAVRASHFDIPVLLQSDHQQYDSFAREIGASFLLKTSPTLLEGVRDFMVNALSFGDFIFRLPNGAEVGRAHDLRSLERRLRQIPDESLQFHAERNHFSNWLKARTEFWLAHELRPRRVTDYDSLASLRTYLVNTLRSFRKERQFGSIADFDPESFDTTSTFARIGGGSMGGKARGAGFANILLNTFKIRDLFPGVRITIPSAVVLGTDIFDRFLDENNLRDFALRSDDQEEIFRRFDEARFPRSVANDLTRFLKLIRYPLAVRSSSLLEDSRYLPFAGIYNTYMLPNNHRRVQTRLDELLTAIKLVYASTFSPHAKAYIRATPYRLEEEKMAVMIQRLVGTQYDDLFYPNFAGVVRSHNFYPRPPWKSADGIASVALGLGKMVIEGGNCIRFCPRYPRHHGQFGSVQDVLDYTQKKLFALKIDEPGPADAAGSDSRIVKCPISIAEDHGTLAPVGSTYSPQNDTITVGFGREGIRLVTFAPVLRAKIFPLSDILSLLMEMGSWGMSSPAEIEFAVNLSQDKNKPHEFAFLQIRPLIQSHEAEELDVDHYDNDELLCRSSLVLGNGIDDTIHDVVMVDKNSFDRARSPEAALELAHFNAHLMAEGIPYLLIAVGRLGSADPWLGIPVTWDQISGARVIIESGIKGLKVEPSQGTHFFQNITSFRVGYFTVNPLGSTDMIDWKWLSERPVLDEKTFVRHLRFDDPLVVKMNGHQNRGIIFKPTAESAVEHDRKRADQ